MRFVVTVVSAAILLFITYLFIGWMVDGYFGGNMVPDDAVPDSWAAPDSWTEWRDITLVAFGALLVIAGVVWLAILIVLLVVLLLVRRILKENVAPAIDSLKESLDNVRGTTEFVGETAVAPIIRIYSVVKGVRSGISAVTNLPGFISRRKKG